MHEQRRHSRELEKLHDQVAALALEVREMQGKLDQIEKRFDDKDKLVSAPSRCGSKRKPTSYAPS